MLVHCLIFPRLSRSSEFDKGRPVFSRHRLWWSCPVASWVSGCPMSRDRQAVWVHRAARLFTAAAHESTISQPLQLILCGALAESRGLDWN